MSKRKKKIETKMFGKSYVKWMSLMIEGSLDANGCSKSKEMEYRARLVCLAYSQLPGVDFTDKFAPVVNDMKFRIALVRLMMEGLRHMLMDVETAFVCGDIAEEIYMEVPEGMKEVFSSHDEADKEHTCYQLSDIILGISVNSVAFPR